MCVWLQVCCDPADTQCLRAVSVDVEAVVAQALVHTVQVQMDVLETSKDTTFKALGIRFVPTRRRIEVLCVVVHLWIFPPVAFKAEESNLVGVSTCGGPFHRVELA